MLLLLSKPATSLLLHTAVLPSLSSLSSLSSASSSLASSFAFAASSSALFSTAPPPPPSAPASSDTATATDPYSALKMDDIVSLAKRRGFVFPSSDIYNGMSGFYDYGPLGIELKNNIKSKWWKTFSQQRDDIVGLDSSIIASPKIWESSGHVKGFKDPMVDCKETKLRFRADQLFYSKIVVTATQETVGYVCVQEDNEENMEKAAKNQMKKMRKAAKLDPINSRDVSPFTFQDITLATPEEYEQIPSPASLKPTLTEPRDFNLMFQTNVGAITDSSSSAYLRPETAQGIFVNFKNALTTSRQKVPFGIAQIGKAFRNEITPRNFIFRSREFEQMEIEYVDESESGKSRRERAGT